MKTHKIPLNTIKELMRRHCPYHISMEAVITLRDLLEDIASKTIIEAVKKFEDLNNHREKQGLSRLKRLNAWAVKNSNFPKRFINSQKNKNRGLQPNEIAIPEGGNVSADISTKPDRTTNDQGEVV